ncbi:MAG: hypothetical protein KDC83_10955 [Flavobacteriales bacterium]|nr:hypothetical protein [Flavobacteriales bacterium]
MATAFLHVDYVEKEKIGSLKFPKGDVLIAEESKKKRVSLIDQAIDAGNFAQFKVMILFQDDTSVKEVETTIWDRKKGKVYLKDGVFIPLERIHKIKFN